MGLYSEIPEGAIILDVLQNRDASPKKFIPAQYYPKHAMMYRGNGEVIHASTPYKNKEGVVLYGVKKGNLGNMFKLKEEGGRKLFSALAIHHKNPAVQKELANIVKSDSFLATPFQMSELRREDFVTRTKREDVISSQSSPRNRALLELVRGFRNADRIKQGNKISKTKGVSCSNFTSYIIKAAIIDVLFPDGVPERLKEQLDKIDSMRRNKHNKKLDQVDIKEFEEFEKIFLEEIENQKNGKDKSLVEELYRPVKHEQVTKFYDNVSQPDKPWEVSVLIYTEENKFGCVDPAHAKRIASIAPSDSMVVSNDTLEKSKSPLSTLITHFRDQDEPVTFYNQLSNDEKELLLSQQEAFLSDINKIENPNFIFTDSDLNGLKEMLIEYQNEKATSFRKKSPASEALAALVLNFIQDKSALTYKEKVELYLIMKPYMEQEAHKGGMFGRSTRRLAGNIENQKLYMKLEQEVATPKMLALYKAINKDVEKKNESTFTENKDALKGIRK